MVFVIPFFYCVFSWLWLDVFSVDVVLLEVCTLSVPLFLLLHSFLFFGLRKFFTRWLGNKVATYKLITVSK
jgi:hypothetical protein